MTSMLHLLGTGTPTPTRCRFGTAYVLELDGQCLMIDCGPAATYKLVQAGLFPTRIDNLFLTHHHFDHNADLPCFLLCRWDQSTGKENRLRVWGPAPTTRMVDQLIGPDGAFADDWKARCGIPVSQHVHVNRGGTLPRPEPSLDVTDLKPGDMVPGDGWTVTAAAAQHVEPFLQSLAYRVDVGPRSITFTGDTGPCPSVAELARYTDVLVVNCWDHQETMDANGESPGQTGTRDAAHMARDADADLLVLTHTGPALCAPGSRERAVADIARDYTGRTIFADEGMAVPLPF